MFPHPHRIVRAAWLLGFCALCLPTLSRAHWTWTDTDWTASDAVSTEGLDAVSLPGALILANDPDSFIVAFDATDYAGVWSLAVWRGRLYLAACSTPMSDTGGDILVYDYAADACELDYSVQEEGIVVVDVQEGRLLSPGLDSLDDDEWGSVYIRGDAGWERKLTIPGALHVHDVQMHGGRMWVTTGCGPPDFAGKLFVSDDLGDTWTEVMSLPNDPPETFFRRLYGLGVHGGALFVQSDFWLPEGPVIFELGDGEPVTHHLPAADYCLTDFLEHDGKLLCLTRDQLWIYDGTAWSARPTPVESWNFATRGLAEYGGRVYAAGNAVSEEGHLGILHSDDLETWRAAGLGPGEVIEFEALTPFMGRLYAASVGVGEVWVTPARPAGELVSAPHAFPAPVGAGVLEWDALTQPGTSARFRIRSARSTAALASAPFLGPAGAPDGRYETSGEPISTLHRGDRFFQYSVELASADPRHAPVLEEVRLTVEADRPDGAVAAWPQPFAASLTLLLPATDRAARVDIFDARGRRVRTFAAAAGPLLEWDGRFDDGRPAPAGVYFVRVRGAGGERLAEKRIVRLR